MIGSLLWSIGESDFWLVLGSSIKGKVKYAQKHAVSYFLKILRRSAKGKWQVGL